MIVYQEDLAGITPEKLRGFFVGWPAAPPPQTLYKILQQSDLIVLAVDAGSGRAIGFINALSDGVLSAYIPLLEVLPEYQGQGIGGELVRRLTTRLQDIYMVDLVCDAELQPFYRRFGFMPASAMIRRNYRSLTADHGR